MESDAPAEEKKPPLPAPKHKRARTPTLLQMEAVECGAAALGMVLGRHGLIKPLEELRVTCGVSRDGSLASNVLKAARHYGMEAKGFRMEPAGLREIEYPAIIFWNFNHFVTLEGFGKDCAFLNDPAEGPRRVSMDEFDESFTGVVLTMKPGPDFKKGGRKPSLLAALARRARGSEAGILFALIASLAMVGPGLVIPIFSQVFVDKFLVLRLDGWFKPLLLAMALTALLRAALKFLQQYFLLRLETKISVTTSSNFLWHVLRLPVEFYSQRYGGEISSRVGLNDTVARFLSGQLASTAIDALLVVFYAALMFAYDPVLTLFGIISVALNMAVTRGVNRKRSDGNRKLMQESGKAMGTVMGGLATIETLKASGSETDLFARWGGFQAKLVNAQQDLSIVTNIANAVPPLLSTLTNTTVLCVGGLRVMEGDLTMGMLVGFQSLMSSFLGPVNSVVALSATLQEMEGNMGKIDDVLRYKIDPQAERAEKERQEAEAAGKPEETHKLHGYVELKGVTFGYARLGKPLIAGFSLSLEPGRRVAFVGPSGCGKSTIAKVVSGLYEAWEGEILFDGRRRDETPRSVLTNSVAIIDQDISLYEGTIRENLTLWDSTIPDAQIVRACKDACIHDVIISRKGGYDSQVEEGGANFSGGQRQRIEIARALVGNPRVLIMDEATSALDTVTEQIIDRNLRIRGCTCIIIAHRLSTIRDADEIIVLKLGEVMQRGTHEELMRDHDGLYFQLAGAH